MHDYIMLRIPVNSIPLNLNYESLAPTLFSNLENKREKKRID
jgi:hypothetical protein